MLREAGLVDVRARPLISLYPPGHGNRTILVDFVGNLRERLLVENMIGEAELEKLMLVTQRHLDDPSTLVVSAVFFQVWGGKPVRERTERSA